ncbi:50S ribosomal protein L32 [Candidatus Falkowbacteria bacterium]|nr:50S ribosomal protein L32 [Candidatus Falkowbacteria bacterium]
MALPTQKHTKSRTRKRKPSLALKKTGFTKCPKCQKPILPHRACSFCGTYAGKQILKIKESKFDKKKKKKEEEKEKNKSRT